MPTTAKPRLRYFDMLKGVAIFLVVMGHVITMCVREIDRATLFKLIEHIHMPLFFFVSGWFTFRLAENGKIRIPSLGQRALRLLLPMVAVSSLFVWYFPHSGLQSPLVSTFNGLWTNVWKNGYWFTLVLFEIILIYAALAPLLSKCRTALASVAASLGLWAVMCVLYCYVIPAEANGYLSFELTVSFFPVFMFGVLARRYRDGFISAVHNSTCQTIAMIVLALTMYVCCWPWEFGIAGMWAISLNAVLHITMAIVAFAVFERWSEKAFAPEASVPARNIAGMWEYIGRQSLAVYLLHYFFLFPMGVFRPWLEAMNVAIVPMALFSAFWAAAIIAVVLIIVALLRPSRVLSMLLTGSN